MALKIQALSLFAPVIASSTVFAARRAEKGVDAMDENPFYGIANLMIAGGQTLKGIRAARDLSLTSTTSAAESIKELNNTAKNISKTSKFAKYAGKTFDFISKNVNPLICVASLIKVFGSDDKADTAVREICGLGTMFACEAAAKSFIGMPYNVVNEVTGESETKFREAFYKKSPYLEKQVKAFEDYCATKKLFNKLPLKSAPGAIKGTLFVLASIMGYKLGGKIANLLIGKENSEPKTVNQAPMTAVQAA